MPCRHLRPSSGGRTYNCITIQSADDDYLMNETRRKPTTGTRCPTLFEYRTFICPVAQKFKVLRHKADSNRQSASNTPVTGPFDQTSVNQMSCRPNVRQPNVLSTKRPSTKCPVDQMSCRPNVLLTKRPSTKCPVDQTSVNQMSCRPNVLSTKCPIDQTSVNQMSCRPNVRQPNVLSTKRLSTKCPVDQTSVNQMSCRPNVLSTKCPIDQTSVNQMSCRPNVLSTKRLSTKCPVDQTSVNQMSY